MTILPEIKLCLEAIDEPLSVVSIDGLCLAMNKAFAALIGTPQHSAAGLELTKFWPEASAGIRTTGEINSDFVLGGTQLSVRLAIHPLGSGQYLMRVLPQSNKSLSRDSFHSQRLQTLGMLAGGIAHDFNNMLAGILGHVSYLSTILPERGAHQESLSAIEDGAKKASGMIQQILGFSKLENAESVSKIDLCELVKKTRTLLRGAISPAYQIDCEIPKERIHVLGVEAKLAQIIANLVINSRDALANEGFIRIVVGKCREVQKLNEVFNGSDLSSNEYAVLSVVDNGHGMSQDVLRKAFDPYFSTKKEKGTGLGLATVQSIVRSYGGAIEVKSRIREGTTISAYLPLVESVKDGDKTKSKSAETLKRGKEKVLVIDDEYPVRNVLSVSLNHLGYQVSVAASGEEAIEMYRSVGGYDLVLLDMLMPYMPGEKVFASLKEIDPNLRVLVISGFTSEAAVQQILKNGGLGFMQKPFTIEELSKKVRECLDVAA